MNLFLFNFPLCRCNHCCSLSFRWKFCLFFQNNFLYLRTMLFNLLFLQRLIWRCDTNVFLWLNHVLLNAATLIGSHLCIPLDWYDILLPIMGALNMIRLPYILQRLPYILLALICFLLACSKFRQALIFLKRMRGIRLRIFTSEILEHRKTKVILFFETF